MSRPEFGDKSLYYHNELSVSSSNFISLPPSRPSSMVCTVAFLTLVAAPVDAVFVGRELLKQFNRPAALTYAVKRVPVCARKHAEAAVRDFWGCHMDKKAATPVSRRGALCSFWEEQVVGRTNLLVAKRAADVAPSFVRPDVIAHAAVSKTVDRATVVLFLLIPLLYGFIARGESNAGSVAFLYGEIGPLTGIMPANFVANFAG